MKISVHAIPLQSFLAIGSEVPMAKKSSSPIGEPRKPLRIRLGFHKTSTAYRNPSAAAAAAQLCIKRLYAVKDGYTR